MTSPSFDFSARQLPDNVRYVGPQLDDPDWAAEAKWRRQGSEPLVLVAASPLSQQQTDLLQRIAQALGPAAGRAVLTTGRGVDPVKIEAAPNVEVLPAAPHGRILREASVVVTHAGHGLVLKSLASGVPLVCMPLSRDQKDNTVRVLRLGRAYDSARNQQQYRLQRPSRRRWNAPSTKRPHNDLPRFSPGRRSIDHALSMKLKRSRADPSWPQPQSGAVLGRHSCDALQLISHLVRLHLSGIDLEQWRRPAVRVRPCRCR